MDDFYGRLEDPTHNENGLQRVARYEPGMDGSF